jgi:hypothetical protein
MRSDENDEGSMEDKDDHQGFLSIPPAQGVYCCLLFRDYRRVSEFLFVGVSQRFFFKHEKVKLTQHLTDMCYVHF